MHFFFFFFVLNIFLCILAATTQPHLKKLYRERLKKVREFVDSVANFNELISPNSLYLHFLGHELSIQVLKHLERNKCLFVDSVFFL